jgi:Ras-related protein Rab-2A
MWLADVREHADPQLSCILVGNKSDLCADDDSRRAVPEAEAAAFADAEGLLFVEASAKNGANVEKAFADACADVLRKVRAGAFDNGRVRAFRAYLRRVADG